MKKNIYTNNEILLNLTDSFISKVKQQMVDYDSIINSTDNLISSDKLFSFKPAYSLSR